MWRVVVDGGMPLTEVNKWSLDDVAKFNAILDMRNDYQTALNAYTRERTEQ